MTEFERSQQAHNRLAKKYGSESKFLRNYHTLIYFAQSKYNRVLTREEKQSLFNSMQANRSK